MLAFFFFIPFCPPPNPNLFAETFVPIRPYCVSDQEIRFQLGFKQISRTNPIYLATCFQDELM